MTISASTPRLRATLIYYLCLVIATGLIGRPALPPTSAMITSAAALLLVAGAVLGRIWCSVFIAGRKDAQLVTAGPYASCRHPLYLLSMIGGLGLGLATHSITLTLLTLVVLGMLFWRASRAEERFLEQLHGEQFTAYAARTPRFLPRLSRYLVPAQLPVQPQVLWKAFLDAGSFIGLLVLVELSRHLRDVGVFETLLRVP
jgi:protein-S-isoprenylcysteine O-methyltransferase Ste14